MLTKEILMERNISQPLPSPNEVMEWFKVMEAGWVYERASGKAHAILHSGMHSDGFFLCKRLLKYGNLRELLAACIVRELCTVAGRLPMIHGVFGSPYSAILLAGDVARMLRVPVYVPEKDPSDPQGKRMIFKPDDPIPEGAVLLQVEELVTTWASGDATKQAIIDGNPHKVSFCPFVGVLIHRPPALVGRELRDGRTIVPFIEKQVAAWDPKDCPLCKAKSKPVFPKEQWAELTA